MSNKDFLFIIVLIFFLSAITSTGDNSKPNPVPVVDKFELMDNESNIAIYANSIDLNKEIEPIIPVELCKCNGTGKIRTPDGLDTIPCPCGPNCKCAKTEQAKRCPKCGQYDCKEFLSMQPQSYVDMINQLSVTPPSMPFFSVEEPKPVAIHYSIDVTSTVTVNESLDKQVLFFTSVKCPPCQFFKSKDIPELKSLKWDVSEDINAQIRIVDIDKDRTLFDKYRGEALPTFVLLEKGHVKKILVGYHTAKQITDMWYGTN